MKKLDIFCRDPLQVRHITVPNWPKGVRILYASDLHLSFSWTQKVVRQLLQVVTIWQPDIVFLGGDMVDHKAGLPILGSCIVSIKELTPVYAVLGNHDIFVGKNLVRKCVENNGGMWLQDTQLSLEPWGLPEVLIVGGAACPITAEYPILIAHDPEIFPEAFEKKYRLVFAGHLHGGQWVIKKHRGVMYPGAWFYRWNRDSFFQEQTAMYVCRGANDTLPIRWNCPREVIICDLGTHPKSQSEFR